MTRGSVQWLDMFMTRNVFNLFWSENSFELLVKLKNMRNFCGNKYLLCLPHEDWILFKWFQFRLIHTFSILNVFYNFMRGILRVITFVLTDFIPSSVHLIPKLNQFCFVQGQGKQFQFHPFIKQEKANYC